MKSENLEGQEYPNTGKKKKKVYTYIYIYGKSILSNTIVYFKDTIIKKV